MTLIVIGGSGFIGSRLCALLQKNNIDFIIIDKNQSHFFPEKVRIADIRDINALRKTIEPCDCLINLAA